MILLLHQSRYDPSVASGSYGGPLGGYEKVANEGNQVIFLFYVFTILISTTNTAVFFIINILLILHNK